jgi:ABC-type branched-subunit amino acid transport system substrate-binding protein
MFRNLLLSTVASLALLNGAVAQETIKIGVLMVDSGPFAPYLKHAQDPTALAIETLNAQGGALGRKYEAITQAYNGTPAGAVAAATRLVQQQGAALLTGFNITPASVALIPRLADLNALLVDPIAVSNDMIGKYCNRNYVHLPPTDSMYLNALRAEFKKNPGKTWNILVPDYSTGHDIAKNATELIQESGGTVQSTLFAPMSTTDFGSFITQLTSKPADGLVISFPTGAAVALAKQAKQYGMFEKYKAVLSTNFTNDVTLDAQGDATVGALSPLSYFWSMQGARNAAFVKAFEQRFNRKPNFLDADVYQAYEILHAAIVKAKSTDVAAVRSAMSGLKATTIFGDVQLRPQDNQLVRPIILAKVVKAGEGKATMSLLSTEAPSAVLPSPSPECKL